MIEFRVLGSLDLRKKDGEEFSSVLSQPLRTAFLSFLALESPRSYHRRDKLIGTFWPEMSQDRARAALRRTLHFLRQSLGRDVFLGRGDEELSLEWSQVWCDAVAFEDALEDGDLETALELYRGDLLTGFFLPESPDFEEWLERERERFRERASGAAWELAHRYIEAGCLVDAERMGQKAMGHVGTDESAVRGFIEVLARAGDRAAAVRFYEKFAQGIRKELELEPSPETRAVVQALRTSDQVPGPSSIPEPSLGPAGRAWGPAATPPEGSSASAPPERQSTPRVRKALIGIPLVILAGVLLSTPWAGPKGRGIEAPPWVPVVSDLRPGVAVLPCTHRNGGPGNAYLAPTVHLEILRNLRKIPTLRTVGRKTMEWFRRNPRPVKEMSEELGVDFVGECRVETDPHVAGVQIQFTLSNSTGEIVWEEGFPTRTAVESVLGPPMKIAQRVAAEMGLVSRPAERVSFGGDPTRNQEALREYDLGAFHLAKRAEEGFALALVHLNRAIELDPGLAKAYAALAICYVWAPYYSSDFHWDRVLPLAQEAANTAATKDPMLPDAFAALGVLALVGRGDAEGGREALWHAIALDPAYGEAYHQLGTLLSNIGEHDEAIWAVTEALKLDPYSPIYNTNLGTRFFWAREPERALEQLDFTLELHSRFIPAWKYKAFILAFTSRFDEAEDAFKGWGESAGIGPDIANDLGSLVSAFGRTGVPGRLPPVFDTIRGLSPGDPARLAVLVGDYSKALGLLEPGEGEVWPWTLAIAVDPILDPLRSDPRFQALLERAGGRGP